MKKLLGALLLAATLVAQAESDLPTINQFAYADEVDGSLVTTFSLVRNFPDSCFDSYYLRPTREQLEDIIHFYQLRRDFDVWTEEAADCDDIAREFLHVSHVWLRRTFPDLHVSISVAMVYVEIDGDYSPLFPESVGQEIKGLHALNAVWLADGSWVFVEPQTGCITAVEPLVYEGIIYVFRADL